MKLVLLLQLAFFAGVGTLLVRHEAECARVQAIGEIIVNMSPKQLSEVRI